MITKTDAIVIKSMRYRDSSKIVTFYTRRYGKMKGVAKGARDIKSKFGASLEPITYTSLVFYKKEHRDLQLISQCDIVRPYKRIHSDIDHLAVALSILELVNQVTHDEEENLPLFTLLVDAFDNLEHADKNYQNLFYAFELRLSALFGFAPSFQKCLECRKPIEFSSSDRYFVFDLTKGGLYCTDCATRFERAGVRTRSTYRIDARTAKILERLLHARVESVSALDFNNAVGNELDETLRLYLRYHFEELKPLKTREVFQKMNA